MAQIVYIPELNTEVKSVCDIITTSYVDMKDVIVWQNREENEEL